MVQDWRFCECDTHEHASWHSRLIWPTLVAQDVAAKTGVSVDAYTSSREETKNEIIQSVKREVLHFNDPTYMHKLQLQVAVQEERYEDASECAPRWSQSV